MSKSLGNVIEVNPLLQSRSADVSRFYLLWKCSPIESMNFDVEELKGRPYQVLSTLYHLHRFFMQNAEYDQFNPQEHTLQRAKHNNALKTPDRWLLSKLQGLVKEFTEKAEASEFQFALSGLEEFVVNVLSRQYVPMIRRDLWSDDPETLNRRQAIYATLWYALKKLVLLFNPTTSFLAEAMHQKVYRELDNNLPETVNLESWPKPDSTLEDAKLEQEYEVLLRCLPLVYSARQSARLKRRWPLNKAIVVAPENVHKALKNLEELFLDLANIKKVEYDENIPEVDSKRWMQASDVELHVLIDTLRDQALEGEGLMRDLARRVQALRKELGFTPTDILKAVRVAELDSESVKLLEPYLNEMAELVRAKKVFVQEKRVETKAKWHERSLDHKKIYVAIS